MNSPVRYVEPGYIVFVRGGDLVGQRFDMSRRQVSGEVFPIAPQVADVSFGASANGTLAYRAGSPVQNSTLVWFDRTGKRLRNEALSGSIQAPSLSRDGKQVVVERTDAAGTDLWSIDLARGTSTRLTDDQAPDDRPVLSPDGTQVAFTRKQKIIKKFSSGIGAEEVLADGETTDWSPDGKYISFIRDGDLWAVPLFGDKTPMRLVQTNANDRRGRFSPDGKWIAYESNFSGRYEVYSPAVSADGRAHAGIGGWRRVSLLARRRQGAVFQCSRSEHHVGGDHARRDASGQHAPEAVRGTRTSTTDASPSCPTVSSFCCRCSEGRPRRSPSS